MIRNKGTGCDGKDYNTTVQDYVINGVVAKGGK